MPCKYLPNHSVELPIFSIVFSNHTPLRIRMYLFTDSTIYTYSNLIPTITLDRWFVGRSLYDPIFNRLNLYNLIRIFLGIFTTKERKGRSLFKWIILTFTFVDFKIFYFWNVTCECYLEKGNDEKVSLSSLYEIWIWEKVKTSL